MHYADIFKIYSIKALKREKTLFIFTAVSIFLNVCVSLSIPQIESYNKEYIEKNIEEINGGDLQVAVNNDENNEFDKKIEELKQRGIDVTECYGKRAALNFESNKFVSTIISEDNNLADDEIILSAVTASNMKINIGDKLKINLDDENEREFKVKEIENTAKAVDKDSEILGYGKINNKNINYKGWNKRVFLKGEDGNSLMKELETAAPNYNYTTLEEKRNSLQDSMAMESIALGILSTVTYVLSTICIITTIMMLLIKRKKDIAILRLISTPLKDIKIAALLEFMIWIIPSIILGAAASFPIGRLLLIYKGIYQESIGFNSLIIIGRGLVFNLAVFTILVLILLRVIGSIKPLAIFRDDKSEMKRQGKFSIAECIIAMIVIILLYSFLISGMGSFISLVGTSFFIIIFLALIALLLKFISRLPWRKLEFLYAFKSIKKSLLSFILVILSITMTLWFLLIGFYLNGTLKDNMNEAVKDALPYNYELIVNDENALENVLNNDNNINGYDKVYEAGGEIEDDNIKKRYRNISLCEINKEDYGAEFNIAEGEDLFEGNEEGVIISDDMYNKNKIEVGDSINIKTEKGSINARIKGVYKSSGINTNSIYKENKNFGKDVTYFINAGNDDFLDKITDAKIYNIKDIGNKVILHLLKFLNVFKILTLITVFSAVLFNVNMINISYSIEEKDEAVIKALGLGNGFLKKVKNIKLAIIVMLSSVLSAGIFSSIVKLGFKAAFKYESNIKLSVILIIVLTSLIIADISIKLCRKDKDNLSLLREQ